MFQFHNSHTSKQHDTFGQNYEALASLRYITISLDSIMRRRRRQHSINVIATHLNYLR